MQIHLTHGDGTPIYRQIITQVKYLIAAGRLAPGDALPPIRTLAQELLINPNTVARAYKDLENLGLIASRQGAGTVVSDGGSPLAHETKVRILEERIDGVLAEARQLGIPYDELLALIAARHEGLAQPAKKGK
jgi:GntR family transcriptional regulator